MFSYLFNPDLLAVDDAVELCAEETVCAILCTVARGIAAAIPCQVHCRASNPPHQLVLLLLIKLIERMHPSL